MALLFNSRYQHPDRHTPTLDNSWFLAKESSVINARQYWSRAPIAAVLKVISPPVSNSNAMADVPFVTFTWSRDVHYAKALLGSISYFYPERRIIVVAERDVSRHDIAQIRRFPNTEVIPVMDLVRRHKLHFVGLLNKLNVLFLPGESRAIVADADSVLVDGVCDKIDPRTVFTSLYGSIIAESDAAALRSFETWAYKIDEAAAIDQHVSRRDIRYIGGSHFYVSTERFPYDLLFKALPYMGFRHGDNSVLKAGDQGFWNLVVNSSALARDDCAIVPCTICSEESQKHLLKQDWNTYSWLTRRSTKDVSFIHYVGSGRKWLRKSHLCPAPLQWGTALYYEAIGRHAYVGDEVRRFVAVVLRKAKRLLALSR